MSDRNESRDRCFLLLMFRHGLRVSEALGLTIIADLDLEGWTLHVRRLKKGLSTTHPLRVNETKAITKWLADRDRMQPESKMLCAVTGHNIKFTTDRK